MRAMVLLNGAAGTLARAAVHDPVDIIKQRFVARGWECDVREVNGKDLAQTTRQLVADRSYDLIVAGGGDGTLNTVASAMVGSDIAYGVLPLGTFNHFAKELEMPLELESAVDALAGGTTVPFAIGKVNDRHFLLSCSVGLYTDMVRHRDAQREALGRRKLWAGFIAFCKMMVRWPLMRLMVSRIQEPDRPDFSRLTSTAFVSISGYQMQQMGLRDVPSGTRNALTLLISPHVSRMALLGFLFKAMFRRARSWRDVERIRAQRLELGVRHRAFVRVGYDGEVETMKTPLQIQRIENALNVRMPAVHVAATSERSAAVAVS